VIGQQRKKHTNNNKNVFQLLMTERQWSKEEMTTVIGWKNLFETIEKATGKPKRK